MGTGGFSSSLLEELELSAGFVLSAAFVAPAALPSVVLACFGTAAFGAGFPSEGGSVLAGAALLESAAAGAGFTGEGTAWEDFVWVRQEQHETRQILQQCCKEIPEPPGKGKH